MASGPLAAQTAREAEIPAADTFESAGAFLPLDGRTPGVVLLPTAALPVADVSAVLVACTQRGRDWVPVLVEASNEGLMGIPLAAAYRWPLAEVGRFCREGGGYLAFHQVIDRVRVARHDINNPLAAALAETQLLLMDATDPEVRRALEAIQAQLRRIATLVSALAFAPPARPPEMQP